MALRLAGEQLGVLRGMDSAGWLREVTTSDALAGLRVNQLGTGRIADFQDGGASKLHVLDGGRVVVADSIEIGTNPATAGMVRVPNTGGVTGRNAAGSADIPLVELNASNIVVLGDSNISGIRLGNSGQIAATLAVDTGMMPRVDATAPLGSTALRYLRGVFSESLQVGTNPAAVGAVRFPNASAIHARNATNTGNIHVIGTTTANRVEIDDGANGTRIGAINGALAFLSTVTPITQRVSAADLTNSVTAGGVNDTIANYTDLTTYATDAAAIRNNIYQLARQLKQINDGLRAYGLFG